MKQGTVTLSMLGFLSASFLVGGSGDLEWIDRFVIEYFEEGCGDGVVAMIFWWGRDNLQWLFK